MDDENKEVYIIGDLNCDLHKKKQTPDTPTKIIKAYYELYQLTQLLHHISTNKPEKISHSLVIHTGLSDRSLVYPSLKRKKKMLLKSET